MTERRDLWVVQEIGAASVPPEEWERIPADLSVRLDSYLYDTPRDDD
jgi:hypothetical protein